MEHFFRVSGLSAPRLLAPFVREASIWAGEWGIFRTRGIRFGGGSFRGSSMGQTPLDVTRVSRRAPYA
jgi:hypothetical protein